MRTNSPRAYEQTRFAAPPDGLLVQTHALVALGWLEFTVKLVAVPVVEHTTPPESVKPGRPVHAPEKYELLSTK